VSCSIEPIRFRLPVRYWFKSLDVYRSESLNGDFAVCVRADLSREEAEEFVTKSFAPEDRVSHTVNMWETHCPASFWPKQFVNRTMAYKAEQQKQGSRGAVYEDGQFFFWSNYW
jgi:hypothetical protein